MATRSSRMCRSISGGNASWHATRNGSRRAGLRVRGRRPYVICLLQGKVMTGLHCVCGESFMASCDIDQDTESCAVAWLLLLVSAMVHVVRCCAWGGDDEDSDGDGDGEPCTMYT